jgi:hypothetical protein
MRSAFLTLLLLLAACPEQVGLQCPPNTAAIGQYALSLQGNHDAGECIAVPGADAAVDAGPLALTVDDGGTRSATFCLASNDGGPELQLLVPGKGGVRKSALLADGGFRFVSDPVPGQGTACVCDVTITETFAGSLLAGGVPVALQPDGGLPPVDSIAATVVDAVTDAGDGTNCRCALPCTVSYGVKGSPF